MKTKTENILIPSLVISMMILIALAMIYVELGG